MASYLVCNGTLNINQGVPDCTEWLVYEHNPAASLSASLPPDSTEVQGLLGGIILVLCLAWIFRLAVNQLINRGG